MHAMTTITILVVLCAIFAYLNDRLTKLPTAIGLLAMGMATSGGVSLLGAFHLIDTTHWQQIIHQIDLQEMILNGMLSILLFAAALNINLDELMRYRWPVGLLASIGVGISTLTIGCLLYGLCEGLGIPNSFLACLVFGALISPTDPIAVLALLKEVPMPESIRIKMVGESLFNDGTSIVICLAATMAWSTTGVSAGPLIRIFVVHTSLGIGLGVLLGWITWRMLASLNNSQVEILVTIAAILSINELCHLLHASTPLAAVTAGLVVGYHSQHDQKPGQMRNAFWALADELLTALLFVIIGLEILIVHWTPEYLLASLVAIIVCLCARWFSVWVPLRYLRRTMPIAHGSARLLTWGGIRGGISVALALSLPPGPHRQLIITMTYCVVAWSILVQGLTMKPMVTYLGARTPPPFTPVLSSTAALEKHPVAHI